MNYREFIKDKPEPLPLDKNIVGGGQIHTEIVAPGKKLVTETKYYGNHTEITNWKHWKKRRN